MQLTFYVYSEIKQDLHIEIALKNMFAFALLLRKHLVPVHLQTFSISFPHDSFSYPPNHNAFTAEKIYLILQSKRQ